MANFIERLLNGEKKTLHNLEKTAEQVMALAIERKNTGVQT